MLISWDLVRMLIHLSCYQFQKRESWFVGLGKKCKIGLGLSSFLTTALQMAVRNGNSCVQVAKGPGFCLPWQVNYYGRVHATVFAVENNKLYTTCMPIGSHRYPVCSAHEPFSHLWSVRLYNIFPRYLLTGKIFEKKKKNVTEHKTCVSSFSTTLSETFLF